MKYLSRRWHKNLLALAFLALVPALSFAGKLVFQTENPFGGPFDLWGMDVYKGQSAAIRFTSLEDSALDKLSLWLMNNTDPIDGIPVHGVITLSLVEDKLLDNGKSIPSENVLETWTVEATALGWEPVEESAISVVKPVLNAGKSYWVVAHSNDKARSSAVWCIASFGVGYISNTQPDGEWLPIGADQTSAVLTLTVEATPVGK